jgi:hypothetical protein
MAVDLDAGIQALQNLIAAWHAAPQAPLSHLDQLMAIDTRGQGSGQEAKHITMVLL